MKQTIIIFTILFSFLQVSAQQMTKDSRMAERYFNNGEYDKAAVHYKKLYYDKQGVQFYYKKYFETLVKTGDLDELNKMVNKAFKETNGDVSYLVDLGYVYSMDGDTKMATTYYEEALEKVRDQQFAFSTLAAKFINYSELSFAERSYAKGREVLNDASMFNFELAYLYSLQSKYEEMVTAYLQELYFKPERLKAVQSNLQRYLSEDNFDVLEAILLKRVQREPRVLAYQELLTWMYMNMNDFDMAFIQARSIDINFGSNGRRILELARTAAQQEEYNISIKAYQYLMDRGPELDIFVTASLELINVKRDKVVNSPYYTEQDLRSLEASYHQFVSQHDQDYTTGFAMIELGKLEAFYIHNIDTAVALLEDLLLWPRLNKELEAKAKIDLGDYYLLKGEHWESTLLYGQVEKAFRGSPVSEEAKLKNARLSYYKGDFEWSKTQLDILKSSTTELISNDAIELSVFIADNLNLDTTDHPMMLFAAADLKFYQNRMDDAIFELEGLLRLYPNHSLTDDVYYKRALIAIRQQQYEVAVEWLNKIVDGFNHDLLTDNALYLLGDVYMNYLKDEDKAREAFESLILNHQGSTFVVDARKKFRKLRGDILN
ncbi:MAG: tetratricopeptide repeat protein [Bacteroidetes bacterium]|nr:tetratricopeptide repeat protein [Bacteroidota bacterium]